VARYRRSAAHETHRLSTIPARESKATAIEFPITAHLAQRGSPRAREFITTTQHGAIERVTGWRSAAQKGIETPSENPQCVVQGCIGHLIFTEHRK